MLAGQFGFLFRHSLENIYKQNAVPWVHTLLLPITIKFHICHFWVPLL